MHPEPNLRWRMWETRNRQRSLTIRPRRPRRALLRLTQMRRELPKGMGAQVRIPVAAIRFQLRLVKVIQAVPDPAHQKRTLNQKKDLPQTTPARAVRTAQRTVRLMRTAVPRLTRAAASQLIQTAARRRIQTVPVYRMNQVWPARENQMCQCRMIRARQIQTLRRLPILFLLFISMRTVSLHQVHTAAIIKPVRATV